MWVPAFHIIWFVRYVVTSHAWVLLVRSLCIITWLFFIYPPSQMSYSVSAVITLEKIDCIYTEWTMIKYQLRNSCFWYRWHELCLCWNGNIIILMKTSLAAQSLMKIHSVLQYFCCSAYAHFRWLISGFFDVCSSVYLRTIHVVLNQFSIERVNCSFHKKLILHQGSI